MVTKKQIKKQIPRSNNPANPNSDKKFANQLNQNNQLQSTVQTKKIPLLSQWDLNIMLIKD